MKGLVLRASIRKTYSSSTPQPGRNVIEIQQAVGGMNYIGREYEWWWTMGAATFSEFKLVS